MGQLMGQDGIESLGRGGCQPAPGEHDDRPEHAAEERFRETRVNQDPGNPPESQPTGQPRARSWMGSKAASLSRQSRCTLRDPRIRKAPRQGVARSHTPTTTPRSWHTRSTAHARVLSRRLQPGFSTGSGSFEAAAGTAAPAAASPMTTTMVDSDPVRSIVVPCEENPCRRSATATGPTATPTIASSRIA